MQKLCRNFAKILPELCGNTGNTGNTQAETLRMAGVGGGCNRLRNCFASASASASPSASESASAASGLRSSGRKYKGIITFENYVENGKYVAATATNPADNVPRPAPPENINEHSIDGAYAFSSFWLARLDHLMITGDPGPIEMVYYKGYSREKYQSTIKLYASHWLGVRCRNSVYC